MYGQRRFFIIVLLLGILGLGVLPVAVGQEMVGNPIVVYVNHPDPSRAFTVTDQSVPITGTIVFDPALMKYWKVDIRSTNTRSYIGTDLFDRTMAFDWVTLGETRTDTVVENTLAEIPGWPGLSLGSWRVRVVVVGHDDTFLIPPIEIPFTVAVPTVNPVFVEITAPVPNSIIDDSNTVTGSIRMDQFASAYRLELLGGNYTAWTAVDSHVNDVAHPTIIEDGQIGTLPEVSGLAEGQYRLRVVVLGLDANYRQPPYEVDFAVGTDSVSNLASVQVTEPRVSNGQVTIRQGTPLMGTVIVPEGSDYYKVEIRDNIRNAEQQTARFTDWTTIGSLHGESVVDGEIEFLAGPPSLAPGSYHLRIVVVNEDGNFSGEPYEIGLTVQQPQ